MVGFSIKAGIFPFHIWLPVAHPVAPSPASALLSGITIFLGSAAAIFEKDLKKRLAYSSIGQMGYIFMGMFLFNQSGLTGDIFHIVSHAVMKSCLFLAAGIIIYKTGKRNIDELKGIGRSMPVTMICFSLAALAMIGFPPFTGFITKGELSMGALQAGHPGYVVLFLLSSLMNGIYYFPIIINAFFVAPEDKEIKEFKAVENVSWKMLFPVSVLALGTFIFDIIPINIPLNMSEKIAQLLLNI